MMSGLNQEIDLLGKTFHFQTELSDQNGLSIRTEVFVGGKVVATRESRLDESVKLEGEEAIRGRMKEHHSQAVTTFVARARRYQSRAPESETWQEPGSAADLPPRSPGTSKLPPGPPGTSKLPPGPPGTSKLPPGPPGGEAAPAEPAAPKPVPPEVPSPTVADAVKVRKFFAPFRQVVGARSGEPPEDLKKRLARVAQTLTWMIRAELFAEIRIDEQARCHLLKEQIDEWLMGGCDPWRGAQIWSHVATFSDYLAEINLRAELGAHDQQLLIWALAEVQARGMTEAVKARLDALYGRHPRLDRLIDQPGGVTGATWTAHLRSVLTLL